MNLGAFAVIASLRQRNVIGDEIDDMAGLYQRAPWKLCSCCCSCCRCRDTARGRVPGQVLHLLSLIESQHYCWLARRALFALWTVLLPEDREFDAGACSGGNGKLRSAWGCALQWASRRWPRLSSACFRAFIHGVNWSLNIAQNPHVARCEVAANRN